MGMGEVSVGGSNGPPGGDGGLGRGRGERRSKVRDDGFLGGGEGAIPEEVELGRVSQEGAIVVGEDGRGVGYKD